MTAAADPERVVMMAPIVLGIKMLSKQNQLFRLFKNGRPDAPNVPQHWQLDLYFHRLLVRGSQRKVLYEIIYFQYF